MNENNESPNNAIAETENYLIWEVREPDDEVTYHLELGSVTLHLFSRRVGRIFATDEGRGEQ